MTFWNLRSRAPSFSIFFRYSSSVVAPIHCISPRARAGFKRLAASIEPAALPAPTMVCISSINKIISLFLANSLSTPFILSSNSPRYFVPATNDAISRDTTRFPNNIRETLRCMMRKARPSTIADLPTPGSPISTGLFFLRRLSICARRSISTSRPTTGSSLFSSAARVISLPNLSNIGVSLPLLRVFGRDAVGLPCCWCEFPLPDAGSFSSSYSSSLYDVPAVGSDMLADIRYNLSYVIPACVNLFIKGIDWTSLLWKMAKRICTGSTISFFSNLASRALSLIMRFVKSPTVSFAPVWGDKSNNSSSNSCCN